MQRRFNTSQDCRRYLASILNRLENGKIDPAIAGKAAYIVNILVRIIETSDLESRIEELEKALGK